MYCHELSYVAGGSIQQNIKMAKPNKKRGFRKITINGIEFTWRFSGKIDIRPETKVNNQLIVDFGWYDEWLFIHDAKNAPPSFEPKVVTPAFVKECILFAITNSWDIEKKVGKTEIFYRDKIFYCFEEKI